MIKPLIKPSLVSDLGYRTKTVLQFLGTILHPGLPTTPSSLEIPPCSPVERPRWSHFSSAQGDRCLVKSAYLSNKRTSSSWRTQACIFLEMETRCARFIDGKRSKWWNIDPQNRIKSFDDLAVILFFTGVKTSQFSSQHPK